MKKIFSTLFIFIGILGAQAQDALSLIAENPDRAANNMHSYEFVEVTDTPAPEGFVPFYISHYGRHGSRYELNTSFSRNAIAASDLVIRPPARLFMAINPMFFSRQRRASSKSLSSER